MVFLVSLCYFLHSILCKFTGSTHMKRIADLLVLTGWIAFLITCIRIGERNSSATEAHDDWRMACEEFSDWQCLNPGVFLGLSDEGKALLRKVCISFDILMFTHPGFDGRAIKEYFLSLFDDFPPNTPNEKSPRDVRGLF